MNTRIAQGVRGVIFAISVAFLASGGNFVERSAPLTAIDVYYSGSQLSLFQTAIVSVQASAVVNRFSKNSRPRATITDAKTLAVISGILNQWDTRERARPCPTDARAVCILRRVGGASDTLVFNGLYMQYRDMCAFPCDTVLLRAIAREMDSTFKSDIEKAVLVVRELAALRR